MLVAAMGERLFLRLVEEHRAFEIGAA